MKVSIITVTYNSEATLRDTLASVQEQSYPNIEHVIIDGASTDRTLDIVREFPVGKLISEPDKGIYEAMNKGLHAATGDIIGTLNSDDFYPHKDVVRRVVETLLTSGKEAVFGDVKQVDPDDITKVTRHYSSRGFRREKFLKGFMPAHPTFFTKKEHYDTFGHFKTDYKIAADYELLLRFLYVNGLSFEYIPEILVKMRAGGVSNESLKSRVLINKEIVRACAENGIQTNMFNLSLRYFKKVMELINPA